MRKWQRDKEKEKGRKGRRRRKKKKGRDKIILKKIYKNIIYIKHSV